MDENYIAGLLPVECPPYLSRHSYDKYLQNLGGHLAIYKRVSYQAPPELHRLMCPEDWEPQIKPKWAAECYCTSCTETWNTAWVGGPTKTIAVMAGEDGVYYPTDHLDSDDIGPYIVELTSNDGIICPNCGEGLTLVHSSQIKSGTTRRLALCSVDNVGSYTALLYWIAYRHIDADGLIHQRITPWWAFLIDETGKPVCFRHSCDGWHLSRNREDPFFKLYVSGDGGCYNQKRGGYVYNVVPDLTGYTGEKTGLGEYVRQGGSLPLLYLMLWRRHPAVENLVNERWTPLLESLIDKEIDWNCRAVSQNVQLPAIDWSKSKPHEMLSMDKAAYRRLDKSQNGRRTVLWYEAWKTYQAAGGKLDVCQFDEFWCSFTSFGVNAVLGMMMQLPGLDIPKVAKYLDKQSLQHSEVGILADIWRMTSSLTGREMLTDEERWPRNAQRRHDDLAEMFVDESGKDTCMMYLEGFTGILNQFRDLQWTDGELDVIIPKHNGELVREGAVLRHCVGTYATSHISKEQTIFFIRHHRRPERSYYTLSMDMRAFPKRQQLHGYGNERHGASKQFRHSIPKKVLAFCARWESEVVRPWYQEQQRKLKEGRTA